jgi:hypothetical protein
MSATEFLGRNLKKAEKAPRRFVLCPFGQVTRSEKDRWPTRGQEYILPLQ